MRERGEPGLWAGADVRWSGPDKEIDGLRLRRGDPAVVVDPGRHAVRSFGPLVAFDGPAPKPGRNVVIRTAAGKVAAVPRKHLELVAPDHPLSPEPDGSAASWWTDQLEPWPTGNALPVASLVPRGFQAVGRVLHPWGRQNLANHEPVTWAEVAAHEGCTGPRELFATHQTHPGIVEVDAFDPPSHGQLDHATAGPLVELLAQATDTAEHAYFAVWEGWGNTPAQRFPGAAVVRTPGREHFLLRGPLSGALTSVAVRGSEPVSGFWWPEDRAWFVATEIDFDWTFVAGSVQLLDALLADPGLEVTPTSYDATALLPEDPPSP